MSISYKSSGVNISLSEQFIKQIKPLVKDTFNKGVLTNLGHFGAFYELPTEGYKKPVLVSSVDGVGTKVKIAAILNKYDTVGHDLVNHCVNDIAVCGAKPLYFLDYYATGKLDLINSVELFKGLVAGCKENNLSLIGGETAEMPGIYRANDFDLAGSIVGIVDKKNIINHSKVKDGDILIGIPSNGLHTNGYSLARKIFNTRNKLNKYDNKLERTIGEELLKVHKSYYKLISLLINKLPVRAFSHITGGGIIDNTKRVIPHDMKLDVKWNSWKRPYIFDMIQSFGVSESDMRKTFNLGIGLIVIISKKHYEAVSSIASSVGDNAFIIGSVVNKK